MAAGRIAAPGTAAGPCAEPCNHTDCAATRRMAESVCHYCGEAIGYERRFSSYRSGGYEHATCAEEVVERGREPERLVSEDEIWADAREAYLRCAPSHHDGER